MEGPQAQQVCVRPVVVDLRGKATLGDVEPHIDLFFELVQHVVLASEYKDVVGRVGQIKISAARATSAEIAATSITSSITSACSSSSVREGEKIIPLAKLFVPGKVDGIQSSRVQSLVARRYQYLANLSTSVAPMDENDADHKHPRLPKFAPFPFPQQGLHSSANPAEGRDQISGPKFLIESVLDECEMAVVVTTSYWLTSREDDRSWGLSPEQQRNSTGRGPSLKVLAPLNFFASWRVPGPLQLGNDVVGDINARSALLAADWGVVADEVVKACGHGGFGVVDRRGPRGADDGGGDGAGDVGEKILVGDDLRDSSSSIDSLRDVLDGAEQQSEQGTNCWPARATSEVGVLKPCLLLLRHELKDDFPECAEWIHDIKKELSGGTPNAGVSSGDEGRRARAFIVVVANSQCAEDDPPLEFLFALREFVKNFPNVYVIYQTRSEFEARILEILEPCASPSASPGYSKHPDHSTLSGGIGDVSSLGIPGHTTSSSPPGEDLGGSSSPINLRIRFFQEVEYSSLFPLADLVIHGGGAASCFWPLYFGRPQLILLQNSGSDKRAHAVRLFQLGVSVAEGVIEANEKFKKKNPVTDRKRIYEFLRRSILDQESLSSKARSVASLVQKETGDLACGSSKALRWLAKDILLNLMFNPHQNLLIYDKGYWRGAEHFFPDEREQSVGVE